MVTSVTRETFIYRNNDNLSATAISPNKRNSELNCSRNLCSQDASGKNKSGAPHSDTWEFDASGNDFLFEWANLLDPFDDVEHEMNHSNRTYNTCLRDVCVAKMPISHSSFAAVLLRLIFIVCNCTFRVLCSLNYVEQMLLVEYMWKGSSK